MGMTINEAIQILNSHKPNDIKNAYEIGEALVLAISTMRKYQQIQEIVNTWRHDITAGDYHCMAEVAEVVEDDNT